MTVRYSDGAKIFMVGLSFSFAAIIVCFFILLKEPATNKLMHISRNIICSDKLVETAYSEKELLIILNERQSPSNFFCIQKSNSGKWSIFQL